MRVGAHPAARGVALDRRTVTRQPPDGGKEIAVGVFGIKTAFHRPAVDLEIGLGKGQFFTIGHADHLLHQIDAGDRLGHRMLDLKAGVHFQEIEVPVAIDDELHRPGRAVAHGVGKRAGLFAHRLAGSLVKEGRRRLFDDLLVAALDRAFPLVQVDAVAVLVGENLDFDVARLGHELLDEDPVIAEAVRGLVFRGIEAFARFLFVPGDAHPLTAAPGRSLDHDRIADLVGDLNGLFGIRDQTHIAGYRADTRLLSDLFRGDLVAHRLDGGAGRADEHDAFFFKRFRELHVLGQKAVARMHRLGAGLADRIHDLVDHDIGLVRGGRTDMHGLISHLDVQRMRIRVGIDGNGLDPHLACGFDHAAGDLAPVCDQDFLEHLRPFPSGAEGEPLPRSSFWLGDWRKKKCHRDRRSRWHCRTPRYKRAMRARSGGNRDQ